MDTSLYATRIIESPSKASAITKEILRKYNLDPGGVCFPPDPDKDVNLVPIIVASIIGLAIGKLL